MATTDQNSSYTPPAGVTLDMSKSKPVGQAPAYTPPAGVQLDMSKSQPVTPPASVSAPAATDSSVPDQPGVIQRGAQAAVNNTPLALIKPPETPTEQVIHAVSGDSGLAAYRAAMGVVDTVKKVVTAGPEAYANAVQDYKRAHQEFINKDYRNAASSAGSLATDVAHVVDPTLDTTNQTRQLTEGARPGADLTTPLVGQIAQAGTALAGGKIADTAADAAAAPATDTTPFQRMITNPFRKLIAGPAKRGDIAETEAATAGVKSVLGTGGTKTLALGIDPAPADLAASGLYQKVDQAAGTDLKVQYAKLANAEDRVMQTVDGSAEEAKALSDVKAQEDAIAQIKQRAKEANPNLDIDATLAQADKKFTEARANAEFNYKFQSALKGDVRPGAEPLVDVDKAIAVAKKMTQPTIKYPTPRLYQTTIGEAGANNLLDKLYAAKKLGEHAVTMRTVRNWVLGGAAVVAGPAAAVAVGSTH